MLFTNVIGNLIMPMLYFYTPWNIKKSEFSDNSKGYRTQRLA